jgi:hypothetical protein
MSILTQPVYTTNNTGSISINSGNSGQYLYTNGTATSPYWADSLANNTPGVLKVQGDAEFEGDLKLKGKSLDKTLTMIEERLAILHPNEKLEEKWENLRGLRKAYMELEAEIIEKELIWATLKK